MTKRDLLLKLDEELKKKGMSVITDINANSNKATLESAIRCLETSDEEMNDYLTVFKLAYPNSYNAIINNGNWLLHQFNRYYVYTSAKSLLKTN
jgi:hypothetical protein